MGERPKHEKLADIFAPIFVVLFITMAIGGLVFSGYLVYTSRSPYAVITAIFFFCLSIMSGFTTVFTANMYYKSKSCWNYVDGIRKKLTPLTKYPTVAVVMACFNEDAKTVKKNLSRLTELQYPKSAITYYLLDDSTDKAIAKELKAFSGKNGIRYIHRENRTGFKAGALNNMLKDLKEEFVAIFDYDEYLTRTDFLIDLLPFFDDKKLSYLQTEKKSAKTSFYADTVDLFNGFFYSFFQSARVFDNTAIFAGSCGIIRRSALDKVGGFPEYVTEDTFFSFESDMHGYKAIYVPETYAVGGPIESFTALAKQQWRYNYGGNQFLSYFLKKRDASRKKLKLMAKIEYLMHGFGLNFLSVIMILFTIASILLVFFSFNAHITLLQFLNTNSLTKDFEIFGIVSFILSITVPILLAKAYFNSVRKGIMLFAINYSLAFIRTKAAIAALFSTSPYKSWVRSKSVTKNNLLLSVYNTRLELAFAALLFVLSFFAIKQDNMMGGAWLIAYGFLYVTATAMFYKYG
jgi:cellulose synthase (UDP-forming)